MNSLSSSPTKEPMFVYLVNLSSNTIKYTFENIGGNIGELPDKKRETLAIEMIRFLKSISE